MNDMCIICHGSLNPRGITLDYSPFGLGFTHSDRCHNAARDQAYGVLAAEWGLEEIGVQCFHGIGATWSDEQFELHDYWDKCRLNGIRSYRAFDHRRMWSVQSGSPWAKLSRVGTAVMTSEPYANDCTPIPDDSALWWELGYELRMFDYPDIQLHHPVVGGQARTKLLVWTHRSRSLPDDE